MAITVTRYNSFSTDLANGVFDLSNDTIGIILATNGYTPDRDSHTTRDNITPEVATGTGYTQNTMEVANTGVTQEDVTNVTIFDGDNVTWETASITARYAVLYRKTGGASTTDNLICYVDFGTDLTSVLENFTIEWSNDGIISWTD